MYSDSLRCTHRIVHIGMRLSERSLREQAMHLRTNLPHSELSWRVRPSFRSHSASYWPADLLLPNRAV